MKWTSDCPEAHSAPLTFQFRRHRNVRLQQLGDRASTLRILGSLLERGRVGIRNPRRHVEVDGGDGPSAIEFLHRKRRGGVDAFRGEVCTSQLPRQRHGKAGGMRRRDQFFRIGARRIFEARGE
jgi:hypothetical protein